MLPSARWPALVRLTFVAFSSSRGGGHRGPARSSTHNGLDDFGAVDVLALVLLLRREDNCRLQEFKSVVTYPAESTVLAGKWCGSRSYWRCIVQSATFATLFSARGPDRSSQYSTKNFT